MDYFKKHSGEIPVLAAFVLYIIGILNLSMLESPIFLFCGYMGTILLVGGVLTKLEAFPTRPRSRSGIAVALFFVSALLFTTAISSLFIDIKLSYSITHVIPLDSAPYLGYSGDYWEHPDPNCFGIYFRFAGPYVWLFQPLLISAVILLVVAIAVEYAS